MARKKKKTAKKAKKKLSHKKAALKRKSKRIASKKSGKKQKPELETAEKPEQEKAKTKPPRRRKSDEDDEEGAGGASQDDTRGFEQSPLQIYLKQIEKIPLLTPQDEVDLSKKIRSETRGSKEARHRMIQSNLRLVISIAKRYANMGLPFSDLVEEGNIGLMRAVDKFNHKKGYRFSTYASWWIKQAVMRSLSNQGKTIRVPVYMFDTISKWRKMRESLIQKYSRIPTRKEMADAMGIPIAKVKEIERIATQPSSLNAPISIDGSAEIIDLIQDVSSATPEENIETLFEGERIEKLLHLVDERERQILILRFGLKDHEPHTLEETAKQFCVTRERIRQIEMAAIKKIRYVLELKEEKFEDYVR